MMVPDFWKSCFRAKCSLASPKLVSIIIGHVSLHFSTYKSPKKIWGLCVLLLSKIFKKYYFCGFLMLSTISSLPFFPSSPPGGKLCSENLYWAEEDPHPMALPLQYKAARYVLILLMGPLTSPMLEVNTSQCFPAPFSFLFFFSSSITLLRCNIHAIKFTNLRCIAQWCFAYIDICVAITLIKIIDHFQHSEVSCVSLIFNTSHQRQSLL